MKVMSLALEGQKLKPVEVEIILTPGLPQIHFLGLPDQVIRESIHRIKSAIRQQGFEFPKAKQVLVNVRPSHIKKSSRGLELAVAAGLLWETEQIPKPLPQENYFVYGELGLSGEVFLPEDLRDFDGGPEITVLTGPDSGSMKVQREVAPFLRDITKPIRQKADLSFLKAVRPEAGLKLQFSSEQARIIEILGLGGHHALLAGPAGCGKSTVGKSLLSFLEEPSSDELFDLKASWRPLISPHHSVSPLSLVGGGVPPRPGEIAKANRGLLIMDELLEFSPSCQEALREPLEEGIIRISRGLRSESFVTRFQLVATTNLCPCGQWIPGVDPNCRFSRHKCVSYQQRLSGPFLDRFEILCFFQKANTNKSKSAVTELKKGDDILKKLEDVRTWKKNLKFDKERFDSFTSENLVPHDFSSRRRRSSFFKVAMTMADLDFSEDVKSHHVDEAVHLTVQNFERLHRGH